MMEILFATNNEHKIKEINSLVKGKFSISGLSDFNIFDEIPENEDTLEGNALAKARYVFSITQNNVFADDTGLEVFALGNQPGVHSARYAGESKDSTKNIRKLLNELNAKTNRSARFRTVIALIIEGKEFLFEGIVNGTILESPRGKGGFGYDPVFMAEGMDHSFAEIPLELKNSVSHRAMAIRKLIDFLNSYERQ